jgi:hypothetical protein
MEQPSIQQLSAPKGEFCEPPSLADPILSSGYTISPGYIDKVQKHPFLGWDKENPYHHLHEFEQVCSCLKISGMTNEALKWKLFPFSLIESVKQWYTANIRKCKQGLEQSSRPFLSRILSTLPCLCLTSKDSDLPSEREGIYRCCLGQIVLTSPIRSRLVSPDHLLLQHLYMGLSKDDAHTSMSP